MKEAMKKSLSYTAVFLTGVVVCGVALKTWGDPSDLFTGNDAQSRQAVLTSLSKIPATTESPDTNPIALAARALEPSVVTIHTYGNPAPAQQQMPPQGGGDDPFNNPFFKQFFGGPPDQQAPSQQSAPSDPQEEGAASGVIISPDGYVITNNHVVAHTTKITVTVNGKGYDAHLVGTDPVTDIAVVKINTGGVRLTPATLGNSNNVQVGDWAVAVGNPLDIGTTVTLGIISAKSRTGLQAEGQPLQSVIQTDAAINPGNSGGALADIDGRVIGINEAIESPTGYYSGIGFAIPINAARKIATELIENGKVVHPYLGIAYKPLGALSPKERAQDGITIQGDDGVVVQGVAVRSGTWRCHPQGQRTNADQLS
jgi:serine protease Do